MTRKDIEDQVNNIDWSEPDPDMTITLCIEISNAALSEAIEKMNLSSKDIFIPHTVIEILEGLKIKP